MMQNQYFISFSVRKSFKAIMHRMGKMHFVGSLSWH